MNESTKTLNRRDYPAQAVVIWPNGIRGAAVLYPLGATDEETELIRRMLRKAIGRGHKS
jgi:hypothetical protein